MQHGDDCLFLSRLVLQGYDRCGCIHVHFGPDWHLIRHLLLRALAHLDIARVVGSFTSVVAECLAEGGCVPLVAGRSWNRSRATSYLAAVEAVKDGQVW